MDRSRAKMMINRDARRRDGGVGPSARVGRTTLAKTKTRDVDRYIIIGLRPKCTTTIIIIIFIIRFEFNVRTF